MNPALYFQIYSGIVGAYGAGLAADTAQAEYKADIAQIELDTTMRERDRKDRLNRALATSIARTGASGVAIEGSPLHSLKEMERLSEIEGEREALQSRLQKMTARTRGKITEKSMMGQRNLALLEAAATLGTPKTKKKK